MPGKIIKRLSVMAPVAREIEAFFGRQGKSGGDMKSREKK